MSYVDPVKQLQMAIDSALNNNDFGKPVKKSQLTSYVIPTHWGSRANGYDLDNGISGSAMTFGYSIILVAYPLDKACFYFKDGRLAYRVESDLCPDDFPLIWGGTIYSQWDVMNKGVLWNVTFPDGTNKPFPE